MKKLLLFLMVVLMSSTARAAFLYESDEWIDGIYYHLYLSNITGDTECYAIVLNPSQEQEDAIDPPNYEGDIVIPSEVTFDDMTFPVTGIGDYAFEYNVGLQEIEVGGGYQPPVSPITSVTIPNTVTSIGVGAFSGCNRMTSITIPSGVTTIEASTFAGCTGLTSIVIPNTVLTIGENAFNGCSGLTSVILSSKVSDIGDKAFYNCANLTTVTALGIRPANITADVFPNRTSQTLYVPKGRKSAYENADYWWQFKKIVEIDEIDMTNLMVNPNFTDYEEGWTRKAADGGNVVAGGLDGNPCYEAWNNADFDVYQNVRNAPRGVYRISVQGFYRYGRTEFQAFLNGEQYTTKETCPVFVYMNDNATPFTNIYGDPVQVTNESFYSSSSDDYTSETLSDGTTVYFPNGMQSASIAFGAGMYTQSAYGLVVNDGDVMRIGVKGSSNQLGDSWSIWDNFKITWCGFKADVVKPLLEQAITDAEKLLDDDISSAVINELQAAINGGKAVVNGNDEQAMFEALATLYELKDRVNSFIDFADQKVKEVCLANWDTNSDGELTRKEAEQVTDISGVFNEEEITSFHELQFFTGLTSLPRFAFDKCYNLTSITLPNSLTTIEVYAFQKCSSLVSIDIPSSVTSIKQGAFLNCVSLTSINIPSSVTSLGVGVFGKCSSLASVTIPSSVTSIQNLAFSGCSGLTSVTIPNSVTKICERAFDECESLTDITIPNSVTEIGWYSFKDCKSLKTITIPSSVSKMEKTPFPGCSELTTIIVDPDNTLFDSRDNCNAIIESSTNILMTGCKNTIIPNNVTSIGNHAFYGCYDLISLTIPSSVTSLGEYVFMNCSKLNSITIPSSVTSIGYHAFSGCSGLTSVTVEWDHPLAVSENIFENVSLSQATLYVPAGTKAAYASADVWKDFGKIVENKIIDFADAKVKEICVANWDTNHDGELSLAEAAAVTELGVVFKGNEEIVSFDELQYFTGLTSIGGGAFDNCHSLISVIIPRTVTSLESCAFCGTWGLQSLVIPDGVTRIEEMAVAWQFNLFSIAIPSSVTNIVDEAFGFGCLTSVTVAWDNPLAVPKNTFKDTPIEYATLYVPAGSKAAYASADVWKDFGKIVEYIELVENSNMEEEPSEDFNSFWVHEWRTMDEQFEGHAKFVEDPTDAGNHCVKVVARSQAEAEEAGNMLADDEGNMAQYDTQFFILSIRKKIESGARLRLTMRVRADKPATIGTEAQDMIADYNWWWLFGDIDVTQNWQWVEKEVIITPDMTQENNGKAMHTVAFHLARGTDGNVFYFDDIKLDILGGNTAYTQPLLAELIDNMEAIGGYELDDAKVIAANYNATKDEQEDAIKQLQQQIIDRCANAEMSELPVDATGLITNPSFTINSNAYWQGDSPQFQIFNDAEFYMTPFDFHQQLTGLPNGRYLLKVKGFHRPGNNEDVLGDYQQGTDNASAYLFANGESMTLANQASCALEEQIDGHGYGVTNGGTTQYVPDNMEDAAVWFSNGYYENELYVTVTDGTLNLGIHLDENVEHGWVIFDDFRLSFIEPMPYVMAEASNMRLKRQFDVSVGMHTTSGRYNGYQFDLSLPQGFYLQENSYTLSDRFNGSGVNVKISKVSTSSYRVMVYSSTNDRIKNNDGELIRLVAVADRDTDAGEYDGQIFSAMLSKTNGEKIDVEPGFFYLVVPEYNLGDVNIDHSVDVTDVMLVVNHILGINLSFYHNEYADMNGDGVIDVTDIMLIVNVILDPTTAYAPAIPNRDGLSLSTVGDATVVKVPFASDYSACQMTVRLTEGMRLLGARLCGDNAAGREVRTTMLPDGSWRIIAYSSDGASLRSSDKDLLYLKTTGQGQVSLSDILFTTQQCESVAFSDVSGTTGISDVGTDVSSDGDVYDLGGRRHTTAPKQSGIYIKNGKAHSVRRK